MRKVFLASLLLTALLIILILFVCISQDDRNPLVTPTPLSGESYFSVEADEAFRAALPDDTDLNSGITLERLMPLDADQSNNITFAVLNHTDESIIFANQGFGITIFGYDSVNKTWKSLRLGHEPYPEPFLLLPRTEKLSLENNNTWDILENDTISLGYKKIRLYVSGTGKITKTAYAAFLDANVTQSP